mgnify:CR=1 FL=1
MHGIHARVSKSFVLEERLERYADAIETDPYAWAGRWAEACHPLMERGLARFSEVRLDLGCGKGSFVVEAARQNPDVLFVGVDSEPFCIAYASQTACESGLRNVVIVPATGMRVTEMFAPGELSRIYLNFPTPFPRTREARKRLTDIDRLADYRQVLALGGGVRLKTDSQPLRDYTIVELKIAGYDLLWSTNDARSEGIDGPSSEYEDRLTAMGASVYALEATPGEVPERMKQTDRLSLVDYLPADVNAIGYVPHGMESTVENLRNCDLKRRMGHRHRRNFGRP